MSSNSRVSVGLLTDLVKEFCDKLAIIDDYDFNASYLDTMREHMQHILHHAQLTLNSPSIESSSSNSVSNSLLSADIEALVDTIVRLIFNNSLHDSDDFGDLNQYLDIIDIRASFVSLVRVSGYFVLSSIIIDIEILIS